MKTPQTILSYFLKYNAASINSMMEISEEIGKSFTLVVQQLALKYGVDLLTKITDPIEVKEGTVLMNKENGDILVVKSIIETKSVISLDTDLGTINFTVEQFSKLLKAGLAVDISDRLYTVLQQSTVKTEPTTPPSPQAPSSKVQPISVGEIIKRISANEKYLIESIHVKSDFYHLITMTSLERQLTYKITFSKYATELLEKGETISDENGDLYVIPNRQPIPTAPSKPILKQEWQPKDFIGVSISSKSSSKRDRYAWDVIAFKKNNPKWKIFTLRNAATDEEKDYKVPMAFITSILNGGTVGGWKMIDSLAPPSSTSPRSKQIDRNIEIEALRARIEEKEKELKEISDVLQLLEQSDDEYIELTAEMLQINNVISKLQSEIDKLL